MMNFTGKTQKIVVLGMKERFWEFDNVLLKYKWYEKVGFSRSLITLGPSEEAQLALRAGHAPRFNFAYFPTS